VESKLKCYWCHKREAMYSVFRKVLFRFFLRKALWVRPYSVDE
jgi:hypothetical protein